MTLFQATNVSEAASLLPENDQPVVALPVYNSYDDVVQCYEAFFRNTPTDVPLLVVDDGGWDRRTAQVLHDIDAKAPFKHDVVLLTQPSNKGFVLTMNDAFAAAGRADVVILNSDVMVGPGWLERLRAAAYSSTTIGTASALTNYGTIVSVEFGKRSTEAILGGHSVDEAARRVAAGSPQLRPRIPTAVGHCTYVKRALFDVVGSFDPIFSPGYGEEVDLSQRALSFGFEHIAADDVFVYHRGGGSFGKTTEIKQSQLDHERIVERRYPYYGYWVRRAFHDDFSPLAASLLAARRSLRGFSIAVDGMCLGSLRAGTQIGVLETVKAFNARADVREIALYVPVHVPSYVTQEVGSLSKVKIVPTAGFSRSPVGTPADFAYRGYQVREPSEIEWLHSIAERVIVNWLDLIAYHNAAYFADDNEWCQYRDLARLATSAVDGIAFISEHTQQEAAAEGLLQTGVPSRVVFNGVDHTPNEIEPPAVPEALGGCEPGFLFCPGVSYLHKNRLFALRLLHELSELGWTGSLLLAGANPPFGSSLTLEAEFLLEHPELRERVVYIGSFTEGEKTWLYQNAGLVLYPTLSEGFGLVPFEAAHYGAACLSSRSGSLDEILGRDVLAFSEYEPAAVARTAHTLLTDRKAADELIEQVLARANDFTWDGVAAELIELATVVTGRPRAKVAAVRGERGYTGLEDLELQGEKTKALKGFNAAVDWAIKHPELRQKVVPPGSARQAAVRKSVAWIQHKL